MATAGTAKYAERARRDCSTFVLDVALSYETWPLDWKAEVHECLDPGSTPGERVGRAATPMSINRWPECAFLFS